MPFSRSFPWSRVNKKTRKFLEAAYNGDLNLLKGLLKKMDVGKGLKGTVESVKDDYGRTAFHASASGGRTHVCKFLLEEVKLPVDLPDALGLTPLHEAVRGGNHPTITYLLENDANPNVATIQGLTPLHYAAEQGSKNLIRLLIGKGAEVDAKADPGTPLHLAIGREKKEAVKLLLANRANPNLICGTIALSPLVVSIKGGADPNLVSFELAPLEIAAFNGETEIVKCLLTAGANPNVANKFGRTPLEVAASAGNHEALSVLYPVTSPIPTIEDWSYHGVLNHVHSTETKKQLKQKKMEHFLHSKLKGDDAFERKDYVDAINWYSQASCVDSTDAAFISVDLGADTRAEKTVNCTDAAIFANRSLCWARLNRGPHALTDALNCLTLEPNWPKAYYTTGIAWSSLKAFGKAADSFVMALTLDPANEGLNHAFCEVFGSADEDILAALS